jgi:hypothetical protein
VASSSEHGIEPKNSMKVRNLSNRLSDYHLLRKGFFFFFFHGVSYTFLRRPIPYTGVVYKA